MVKWSPSFSPEPLHFLKAHLGGRHGICVNREVPRAEESPLSSISMKTLPRLLIGVVSLLLGSLHPVQAGSPRLLHVFPAGGPRGGEITVELKGSNLADARELLFNEPGFACTELKPTGENEKNKLTATIKIDGSTRLGEHGLRVVTRSGVSDVRAFYVTPFPFVAEAAEDKDAPDKPQPVALGTTVYGRTQNEDVDRYEVEAKQGERIAVEVIAARLQTQQIFDTAVRIAKADGTVLAEVDDTAFTRQDPVASIVAPEDGKYHISIKDSTNSGTGECGYLMSIGSFPRPVAIYPPGGKAGDEIKFTFIGDATGPIQRTIKLPPAPSERHSLSIEDGQAAPQPVFIRVSDFPNVLEAEPNNDIESPTPAALDAPFALNGIIEQPGDVDCFKFTVKKDAEYDVTVHARRLRSALDSVIDIYDAKGNRVGGNDDSGGMDSYQRWKAPADGEYVIAIRDQLFRGGPAFTYRIELTPVAPSIAAWIPETVINSSQERRAIAVPKGNRFATLLRIKRNDIGGDLTLTPQGLPEGVSFDGGFIDKSVDTIPMVFTATDGAAPSAVRIGLAPRFAEEEKNGTPFSIQHDVDVAENGNQRAFYSVREDALPLAIIDEVPAKLELDPPKAPILQGGSKDLKVRVERKGDFKGPVSLSLLYAPPGIGSPGTVEIKQGETEGVLQISANGNAQLAKWKVCVVGSIDAGSGPVFISTQLVDLEVAPPPVSGQLVRSFIDQGDEGSMTLKLDVKREFEGKAKVSLVSLPNGVTAHEIEITTEDKEVKFALKAEANAQPGQHKQVIAQFVLERDGEPMSTNIASGGILRVDKAAVAKN
jgi:hypothetical protein